VKIGEGSKLKAEMTNAYLIDLQIDFTKRLVSRDGEPIDLPPLSLDLLRTLCAQSDKTHSQSDLENALWPGQVVGTDVLKQRIRLLRKALGKTPEGGDYIVTHRNKGYRLTQPTTEKPTSSRGKFTKQVVVLLAVFLTAAVTVFTFYGQFGSDNELTVRVEPFTNSNELGVTSTAFAAGLSMELAGRIASIPKLVAVVSPGIQGADNEDAVLVGQVTRNDERIRVIVTLSETNTGKVIWGQTYDRDFDDIFEVQRDISLHISFILHDEVDPEASERLKTGPTNDYVAYSLFVQALGLADSDSVASGKLLDQALRRDPYFEAAIALKKEITSP